MLYGPGNSQPHKVSGCAHPLHGNGGGIDVHALKAHGRQLACDPRDPTPTGAGVASASRSTTASDPAAVVTPAANPSGSSTTSTTKVKPAPAAEGESESGVLTAVGPAGKGTLPFTGFPLWTAALLALALAGFGLTLRHQARARA
jgi:hypothetical protein